jgi:hypothetical protein
MPKEQLEERLWSERELAERWHMAAATLRKWRCYGTGPKYIKIARRPLYPESELIRWERERRVA